jgi:hypothetical protein
MSNFARNMILAQTVIQLKAFARQDGAILGLVWIASFASMILSPQSSWCGLIAMTTPFIVGWRLCKFRDYALDGKISFLRSLAYSWYTFFYASLLFAIAQYVYFRYLDNGTLVTMLMQAVQMLTPIYKEHGVSTTELTQAVNIYTTLKPIQLTFMFMMQNIFAGLILGLPIAAICARRVAKKRNQTNQ